MGAEMSIRDSFDTLLGTRMDPADFHAMLDQAKARQEGRGDKDEPRVATVALPPRARAATVDDKVTARSSPYTTASVWSVVFFVGILVVPVVAYSVGPW